MSTYNSDDTIAAIASAVGQGARMIVRMSGSRSREISSQVADSFRQPAQYSRLRFSSVQCGSWIYSFASPNSYTGEDIIEFHIPGNPLLARMLLDELTRLGARRADPGEFTARAYFNGRIDLSQAEGVAAIIAAGNDGELRAARQLLAGELARRVKAAMDLLAETLGLVEVGIDFSEEDVEFLSPEQIQSRLSQIDALLGELLRDSARIERLHHTPQFVLVGRPNAGKSTLLNALVGEHRAVVSPQAGTTRDALSADVMLPRGMIRLIDVAGISEPDPTNDIEREMRERANLMLRIADRVVLVQEPADAQPLTLERSPDLVVRSKADLLTPCPCTQGEGRGEGSSIASCESQMHPLPNPLPAYSEREQEALHVSAHSGSNMGTLRRKLDALAFGISTGNTLALNARHVQAIHAAREAMTRASDRITDGPELLAVDLRDALDALGEILGQVTPDDVLGRIFSTFCIGK